MKNLEEMCIVTLPLPPLTPLPHTSEKRRGAGHLLLDVGYLLFAGLFTPELQPFRWKITVVLGNIWQRTILNFALVLPCISNDLLLYFVFFESIFLCLDFARIPVLPYLASDLLPSSCTATPPHIPRRQLLSEISQLKSQV